MTFGDKRLAVSFSLDREMALYEVANELAQQKRFSAFVKRYLQAELQRRKASTITAKVSE